MTACIGTRRTGHSRGRGSTCLPEPSSGSTTKRASDSSLPDEGDRDLFVHYTGIDGQGFKSLAENSKVEYEEEAGDKGPKAVNVSPI